ncbi:MAG: M23 family metallopeptidase [Deltaproteobacteria bacterium]|nr:M23 family metallopeptidase [Deltaproteobacteria bacterium]
MKKSVYIVMALMIIAFLSVGWWLFNTWLEIEKPQIQVDQDVTAIGAQTVLPVTFIDKKSGLSKITVSLKQDGKAAVISAMAFPEKGKSPYILSVPVNAYSLKFRSGDATLTVTAVDHSFFKNQTVYERQITIDLTPPQIFLLNPVNHISPGGTGVIVYRTSEAVPMSGVEVNDYFFKGYPVTIGGKPCMISYFAVPIDAGTAGARIRVVASDQAGNKASVALPYLLMAKKFRSDKMETSDNFLRQKMPEFQAAVPELRDKTLLDTYIYVNTKMREDNFKIIQTAVKHSMPRQLWQDAFLRMKNSAPMALFGDKRIYLYGGKGFGESIHMGVDLASTQQAPIEAANNGVVVFADNLGIYGNTVIIDHGFGLSSLYGHLSSITTKNGAQVKRGDVIGNSGLSGLAGGDHLHFSILVGGQFVDPKEWWDPHWIADNVLKKMAVSY